VAFPERVTSITLDKVENVYKTVIKWNDVAVKPDYFGKLIKYTVVDVSKIKAPETKETVFEAMMFKDHKTLVRFSFK
jgi:hypothetical protein